MRGRAVRRSRPAAFGRGDGGPRPAREAELVHLLSQLFLSPILAFSLALDGRCDYFADGDFLGFTWCHVARCYYLVCESSTVRRSGVILLLCHVGKYHYPSDSI